MVVHTEPRRVVTHRVAWDWVCDKASKVELIRLKGIHMSRGSYK
jgi:hypothetical protein